MDCFTGAMSSANALIALGRSFIGCEIDKHCYELAGVRTFNFYKDLISQC